MIGRATLSVERKPTRWLPLAERLEKGSIPEPNSGCLLWMQSYASNGYGAINYQGTKIRTHRAAWISAYGEIPAGKVVCHKCDVRECINPAHLFLGTRTDNHRDMCAKGRNSYVIRLGDGKFTPADILKIRGDRRRHYEIAREYGVARTTITDIKNGVSWSWVKAEETAAGA